MDDQDYKVFLSYLKSYLSPTPNLNQTQKMFTLRGKTFQGIPRIPKNYYGNVDLLCFCLMPNHLHLLIKQNNTSAMQEFTQSISTRYSIYFNKKYKRVGGLFQGPYKGAMIAGDNYLLHLSRYIHLNPGEFTKDLANTYSSYGEYLHLRKTPWINTDFILKFFENPVNPEFKKINSYKKFVENYAKDSTKFLGKLTLED